MDYKQMYLLLFDATAKAIDLLITAHQQAEKVAMEGENAPISLVKPDEAIGNQPED